MSSHTEEQLDDATYRVFIHTDTGHIDIMCFGMNPVDKGLVGTYESFGDLPVWVQERLSVLSVLPAPPPPNEVTGIGQRIAEHVFWVYS